MTDNLAGRYRTCLCTGKGDRFTGVEADFTHEEVVTFKTEISKIMKSENGQVNMELPDGSWVICPISQISWLMLDKVPKEF